MGKTGKVRQREYRQRMIDQGYRQFAFWLDKDTQDALKLLKSAGTDLSTVVSQAIKHYHSYMLSKVVSSNVTSNRYMSQDLEDHILELRQAGMTLREISSKLASEGYRTSKAEARAKVRKAME